MVSNQYPITVAWLARLDKKIIEIYQLNDEARPPHQE